MRLGEDMRKRGATHPSESGVRVKNAGGRSRYDRSVWTLSTETALVAAAEAAFGGRPSGTFVVFGAGAGAAASSGGRSISAASHARAFVSGAAAGSAQPPAAARMHHAPAAAFPFFDFLPIFGMAGGLRKTKQTATNPHWQRQRAAEVGQGGGGAEPGGGRCLLGVCASSACASSRLSATLPRNVHRLDLIPAGSRSGDCLLKAAATSVHGTASIGPDDMLRWRYFGDNAVLLLLT